MEKCCIVCSDGNINHCSVKLPCNNFICASLNNAKGNKIKRISCLKCGKNHNIGKFLSKLDNSQENCIKVDNFENDLNGVLIDEVESGNSNCNVSNNNDQFTIDCDLNLRTIDWLQQLSTFCNKKKV